MGEHALAGFERALWSELDSTPVVDPHTHLAPDRPQASSLADLVLYHHVWIELVSAGMPATAVTEADLPHELADPGIAPIDRVRAALPYLAAIRNTTCAHMLRVLLEELYQVPRGELTESNLEATFAAVEGKAQDAAWPSQVLREHCHIVTALTVEGRGSGAPHPGIEIGAEQRLALVSGKRTARQTLSDMERSLGCDLRTAADLGGALHRLGRDYSQRPIRFLGLWLPGYFGCEQVTDRQVTSVIRRASEGRRLDPADLSAFTSYAVRSLLSGLLEGSVRTVQVIVGADVLPPHRSLTHWSPEFPGGLARLAGGFPALHFNCSSASDLYTQDLAVLAKHIPNISVAGYWWHTLYPFYLRKSIETRLDMVPVGKIVGFFSDAYHAEWCYPKLRLVERIFAEVLLHRVQEGLLTADTALSLVRPIFYGNPKRIYGLE
jgi:hypothetical protein